MAILNPEHLFEQGERLVTSDAGRPRQADVRRAISAAYYGVFHSIITAAVDHFIGVTNRNAVQYGLAFRSVDHGWLRDLCKEVQKPTLTRKFKPYEPRGGFGQNIVAFGAAVVQLQEMRHAADYDVMVRMTRSDAIVAIRTARAALRRFDGAQQRRRTAFLSLLLFQPR